MSFMRDLYRTVHTLHQRRPYLVPALFFSIMQVLVLTALLPQAETRPYIFWYCDNISFFFAIAFWEGKLQWVKGLSYVGILTQVLWIADFAFTLIGFDFSTAADYVFLEGFTFSNDISVLIHLGIPLVALLYTARIRPQPYSLFYAALYTIGIYIATLAGTVALDNVNCIFDACSQFPTPYPVILWPIYVMVLAIGGYALHEGLYILMLKYDTYRREQLHAPRHVVVTEESV